MNMESKAPLLALDLGRARVGVALSDARGQVASPLCVLPRAGRDALVRAVGDLVQEHGVRCLVVGLPVGLGDQDEVFGEEIRRLARRLGRALALPVVLVDEALSTAQAQESLLEAGVSRAKRKEVVDKVAASIILQRYLDGELGEAPA